MQGFLLGLSSGALCAAYCAPVLLPYLLGEGRGVGRNAAVLMRFLLGRLLGYSAFALVAWMIHAALPREIARRELLLGAVDLLLAGLLIHYSFFRTGRDCPASGKGSGLSPSRTLPPSLLPLFLGLATGLSLCPPLLLALAAAAREATLGESFLFFFTFFLGTSVFLVPAPLLGLLRGFPPLKVIGRMAAGLIGAYYLFNGAILLAGGILQP